MSTEHELLERNGVRLETTESSATYSITAWVPQEAIDDDSGVISVQLADKLTPQELMAIGLKMIEVASYQFSVDDRVQAVLQISRLLHKI